MNVSVFGLGYVGVVTAACLAREGHSILGVDTAAAKVETVNGGRSPVIEEGLDELVRAAIDGGGLRATQDAAQAVRESDAAIVCVGTPSHRNGAVDTRFVVQVVQEIGTALRERRGTFHLIVRSTVPPGTMRQVVVPLLERASGRPIGHGYYATFHPEFLREGTSVDDFYHPPKIVVGECLPDTGRFVLDLYDAKFEAPRFVCDVAIAEMVKYCDNLFHAVKITFANEIGQFCGAHGVDAARVMDIFCQDVKLNISTKYLKPGFAFGGSCLPKDLRAFLFAARSRDLSLPMLENVLPSNAQQIERAVEIVLASEARRIGIFGIAFKPGTDDLRESPIVEVAERLLGKGRKLVVFDANVHVSRLMGGNRSYVEEKLPHLVDLLTHRIDDLDKCEIIVMGQPAPRERVAQWLQRGRRLLDLTGCGSGIPSGGDEVAVLV